MALLVKRADERRNGGYAVAMEEMSKLKRPPRCPWCGTAMQQVYFLNPYGFKKYEERYLYRCRNWKCGADSPSRETAEEAYKAAVALREKKNRVLTQEELQAYTGYAWYEGDHKWYHSSFDYPVWIENGKYNYEGDLYDIPDGVAGRFWLRKPTEEEQKKNGGNGNE